MTRQCFVFSEKELAQWATTSPFMPDLGPRNRGDLSRVHGQVMSLPVSVHTPQACQNGVSQSKCYTWAGRTSALPLPIATPRSWNSARNMSGDTKVVVCPEPVKSSRAWALTEMWGWPCGTVERGWRQAGPGTAPSPSVSLSLALPPPPKARKQQSKRKRTSVRVQILLLKFRVLGSLLTVSESQSSQGYNGIKWDTVCNGQGIVPSIGKHSIQDGLWHVNLKDMRCSFAFLRDKWLGI